MTVVHPDDRHQMELAQSAVLRGVHPLDVTHRIVRQDGVVRMVHEQGQLLPDKSGRPVRLMGTVQDVTERVDVEATLRESEERWRDLFVSVPRPMWVYDLETLQFLAVNDAAIATYGWSRDEFLALDLTVIRPPEESDRLRGSVAEDHDPFQRCLPAVPKEGGR